MPDPDAVPDSQPALPSVATPSSDAATERKAEAPRFAELSGRDRPPVKVAPHRWAWLLRTTAGTAFAAAVSAVLVAPGLRGLAANRVVEASNHIAATLAYFLTALLVAAIVIASLELSRNARARSPWSGYAVCAAGLILALAMPAVLRQLPPIMAVSLSVVTSTVVFAGGVQGLRASHTRAVGAIMLCLSFAGLLRVVAWKLALSAGDAGDTGLYSIGRVVATAGLGFEALAQAIAAAWLGTRSRFFGQVLSSLAIGLAFLLTFSAAHGASVSASPWQAAAHLALASASGLPQPFGPAGLAVFLLAASVFLAGVAAVQREQVASVVAALTLSLIARGALDVPMHALAATAAALWLMLAVSDERSMWEALLAARTSSPGRVSTPGRESPGRRPGSPDRRR